MSAADTETSLAMQALASGIQSALESVTGRDDMGFMLVVFSPEDSGRSNYVSNCDRAKVADGLRFLLDRWEEGMPDIPGHKVN